MDDLQIPVTASLIDIGGGASSLVDSLLRRGWSDVTVLDIAAPALEVAKARLGQAAERVRWLVADMTAWLTNRIYDVWHDRAVFHFLTEPEQRVAYRSALEAGTNPGSLVIMATFALNGPEQCSGEDAAVANRSASLSEKVYPVHSAKVGGLASKVVMTTSGIALAILGSLAMWSFWARRAHKRPSATAASLV